MNFDESILEGTIDEISEGRELRNAALASCAAQSDFPFRGYDCKRAASSLPPDIPRIL